MKATTRQVILSVGLSGVLVAMVGLGFAVGRYTVIKAFDRQIRSSSKAFTLGSLLNDKQKRAIVHAYHEGDGVYHKLDAISWAVPNTPTPFVGNAPTPGVHGVAHINSMQFRSESEIEIPKPKGTYRIFITGGSTAYGSGAPSEARTIGGYLSRIVSTKLAPATNLKYEIFTMANPAWTTTHERIVIENRLSELEPDLILSFSGNNDVHWGRLGRNVLWFRSYADEFFLDLIKKAYDLSGRQRIPEVTQIERREIPSTLVAERLIKNVRLSSYALSQKQIAYVFVLQPALALTGKSLTNRERKALRNQDYVRECYAQLDQALRNFRADNFHYVNLTDVFDEVDNREEIFIDGAHFGDKGNEIIAENIFPHIKHWINR
jgi:lysophospholipase L1-like esterase